MSALLDPKKVAWVRASLSNCKSNAENADAYALEFGVTQDDAVAEMQELLSADMDLEEQFSDSHTHRHLALLNTLLKESKACGQLSASAKFAEMIARLKKLEQPVSVEVSFGAPDAALVRSRIATLMRNQTVRANADLAEIDLDELGAAEGVPDAGVNRGPLDGYRAAEDRSDDLPEEPRELPLPDSTPKAERPPKALATNLLAEELSRSRKV